MKSDRVRRVVTLFLCVLVLAVVALGAGAAASIGHSKAMLPPLSSAPASTTTTTVFQIPATAYSTTPQFTIPATAYSTTAPSWWTQVLIWTVIPAEGPTTGGNPVAIYGLNFAGATAVTFGGTPCSWFSVISNGNIVCYAPAHAAGAVAVRVSTPQDTSSAAYSNYTYVEVPAAITAAATNGGETTPGPAGATGAGSGPDGGLEMLASAAAQTDKGGGGLSAGWIALMAVLGALALVGFGGWRWMYLLGKRSLGGGDPGSSGHRG